LRSLVRIESMVTCCLILHNMSVSDRIMDGDCRARYNPSNNLVVVHDSSVDTAPDYEEVMNTIRPTAASRVGLNHADEEVLQAVTRRSRFLDLTDKDEAGRLHTALMDVLGAQYKEHKANKNKSKSNESNNE